MKELFFATGNQNKMIELNALIQRKGITVRSLKDLEGYAEPPETGSTFRENAKIKAEAACAFTGLPSLADDSGLVVDALNGAPGVYSARYSGENASSESNNQKLLREMKDVPRGERDARFCAVLCLALPDGRCFFSEGKVEGYILTEYRGENGFGYDPLFYVAETGCGMAEMTLEQKNTVSHRSRAFDGMLPIINNIFK